MAINHARFRTALITCILTLFAGAAVHAQLPKLLNSSFEGEPRDATMPRGWYKCAEGTTPDIMPGPWGVYLEPSDGSSYVGLITRENGTFESIGQKLTDKLDAGRCYFIRIDLARSDTYMGYDKPVKLRIWGSGKKCGRDQLITETEFIEHTEWKTYVIEFDAEEDIKYIILEAYYSEGEFNHAGNILIDNLSAFQPCGRT